MFGSRMEALEGAAGAIDRRRHFQLFKGRLKNVLNIQDFVTFTKTYLIWKVILCTYYKSISPLNLIIRKKLTIFKILKNYIETSICPIYIKV